MEEQTNQPTDTSIDVKATEQYIIKVSLISLLGVLLVGWLSYLLLPLIITLPVSLLDRLVFGLHSSAVPLAWLVFAIANVARRRRQSVEDIRGSAFGQPSQKLAIHSAFLQNTLEQVIILVGALLILATLLEGVWLTLLPAAVVVFSVGRLMFFLQYNEKPESRALGMVITMWPAIIGYVAIAIMLPMYWF